jgi:hypothetical protein
VCYHGLLGAAPHPRDVQDNPLSSMSTAAVRSPHLRTATVYVSGM